MNSGIYIIQNSEDAKVYIGSTANLEKRWGQHKSTLRGGYHGNSHLQCAWNKYGEFAFEFGILEYLNNPEELRLAECFWINIYQGEGKELYNIAVIKRR